MGTFHTVEAFALVFPCRNIFFNVCKPSHQEQYRIIMQNNFLPINPENPWLAPLAGWSDLPFRLLCREQGASVACTEMVSVKGLVYGGKNTHDLLRTNEQDSPLAVQIFGAEQEFMQKGVQLLKEQGFCFYDVNVGCSVNKVVKTGAGSAMLKDLPNFYKVAKTVIDEVHKDAGHKIGFKIRLGYYLGEDVYEELALRLQDFGVDWITLHPRYARQGFSGVPKYEALTRLKHLLEIPVIASGDLFTARDGVKVLLETGVNGVMYARGAMSNPHIFAEHKYLWKYVQENTLNSTDIPDYEELFPRTLEQIKKDVYALIMAHLNYAKTYSPDRAVLQMRTIVPRYVRHLENAKLVRQALIKCRSFADLESVLQEFFMQGKNF